VGDGEAVSDKNEAAAQPFKNFVYWSISCWYLWRREPVNV